MQCVPILSCTLGEVAPPPAKAMAGLDELDELDRLFDEVLNTDVPTTPSVASRGEKGSGDADPASSALEKRSASADDGRRVWIFSDDDDDDDATKRCVPRRGRETAGERERARDERVASPEAGARAFR